MSEITMRFDQGTIVLAGFPGVGKTHFTDSNKDTGYKCLDLDSSEFSWLSPGVRNPNFVSDYIAAIEQAFKSEDYDFIFISTHKEVSSRIPEYLTNSLYLVFPELSLKESFIQRYVDRGSPKPFVDMMHDNWTVFIEDLQRNSNCAGYLKLETPKENLSDVIEYIEKWRVFSAENPAT